MRTVTLTYDTNDGLDTLCIEDNDGQEVFVEFGREGTSYFTSILHGDDAPIYGSCPTDDAEAQALFLMGIPHEDRYS